MSPVAQTHSDLEKQLADQIELLKELAKLYDSGKTVAAKAMSTAVRVLLHDTNKSTSLLTLLGRKNIDFFDTNGAEEQSWGGGKYVGSYHGLVGASTDSTYTPYLDEPIPGCSKNSSFNEYWERVVFVDGKGNLFTRKDIILALANQDGGAHVDPGLSTKYAELSRRNSMGLSASQTGSEQKPLEGAELAATRQIAHEVIRTLDPSYPKQKIQTKGAAVAIGGLRIFKRGEEPAFLAKPNATTVAKVGRNEPCPCGSGTKYKKCHGI